MPADETAAPPPLKVRLPADPPPGEADIDELLAQAEALVAAAQERPGEPGALVAEPDESPQPPIEPAVSAEVAAAHPADPLIAPELVVADASEVGALDEVPSPSLEERPTAPEVNDPAPADPPADAPTTTHDSTPAASDPPAPTVADAPAALASDPPPTGEPPVEAPPAPPARRSRLMSLLLAPAWALALLLLVIDRPFNRLGPQTRQTLGAIALVTLGMAALAWIMPLFF